MGLCLDAAATGGCSKDSGHLRAVDHHPITSKGLGGMKGLVSRRRQPGHRIGVLGGTGEPN
jgi:hypothetical protein